MREKISLTAVFAMCVSVMLAGSRAYADCRGCCSKHGGVRCVDGVTQCADGSPLSDKCIEKGCNKCTNETSLNLEQSKGPTPSKVDYDRKDWPHWIDEDNDCQDTRSEILQRDNVGTIKWKRNKPCNVSWGKWICPYTGKTITKASDVDIDHIVPLSHAHQSGGAKWSREKKRAFANDPLNLLVVDDATNQAKGDKGPDEWKPPLMSYWPEYAQKWLAVKKKYGLNISKVEAKALEEMVNSTPKP